MSLTFQWLCPPRPPQHRAFIPPSPIMQHQRRCRRRTSNGWQAHIFPLQEQVNHNTGALDEQDAILAVSAALAWPCRCSWTVVNAEMRGWTALLLRREHDSEVVLEIARVLEVSVVTVSQYYPFSSTRCQHVSSIF